MGWRKIALRGLGGDLVPEVQTINWWLQIWSFVGYLIMDYHPYCELVNSGGVMGATVTRNPFGRYSRHVYFLHHQ
jgi:hypothetical protein